MKSAVCTLFEGSYHYGVGALANSLYANGFQGIIYVGYRGLLPSWLRETKQLDGHTEFSPAKELTLRFILLKTPVHFSNYKPEFMLEVWEKHCPKATAMFYFDPDITIKCRWSFFEEWVEAGVAMCVDVNPSMSANHPIRHAWKQFFIPSGIQFSHDYENYFNAGFVGVSNKDRAFLVLWKKLIGMIGDSLGGLDKMLVADRSQAFSCPDQDALNIAAMASTAQISSVGQDGMEIQHGGGGYIMAHAIGSLKPWNKPFLKVLFLRAWAPSIADKDFYRHTKTPIPLYTPATLFLKILRLRIASLLGRFIHS